MRHETQPNRRGLGRRLELLMALRFARPVQGRCKHSPGMRRLVNRKLGRLADGCTTQLGKPAVGLRYLCGVLVRVISSLFCAGVCYSIWLAAFLLAAKLDSFVVEAILWLLAPVITAAGFAAGIAIFEHLSRTGQTEFCRIFVWPLVGCAIGAGVVYWFGPMLIVFGMFVAGTASVALREVVRFSYRH